MGSQPGPSFWPVDSVQGSTPIPSWLYNSSDPSLHVAEFLNDSTYQRFGGFNTDNPLRHEFGHVVNWTRQCEDQGLVFGNYGSFVGCLLYPNVTHHAANHSLPLNLSSIGFGWNNTTPLVNSFLWNAYTTCLVSMCATQSDCVDTYYCSTWNLLTEDYKLSGAGVAECWQSICSGRVLASTVDADIAGVGILVSYLLQTIIALLGLCGLSTLAFLVWYRKKKGLSTPSEGSISERSFWKRTLREHWAIGPSVLSEFQKAQCYFAIALQIAALILVSSDEQEVTFTSLNLLLLVGLDGVLPVVMTLHPHGFYLYVAIDVLGFTNSGIDIGFTGNYSPACGGNGPEGICLRFPDVQGNVGGAAASAAAIIIMVSEHISTNLASRIKDRLLGQRKRKDATNATGVTMKSVIIVLFHATAGLSIAACVGLEFYWFYDLFTGAWVDFKEWGFGQIVGLTAWFGVFIELAYLEYFGLEDGMNWRFPAWLKVKSASGGTESKHEHDNTSASEAEHPQGEYQKVDASEDVQIITQNQRAATQILYLQLHDQD